MIKVRQEVFDTYWKTAAERQEIFYRRLGNNSSSLTADPIFQKFKFCNVFRACDRVSQFLIKEVIYGKEHKEEDLVFRMLLFRLLNRVESWRELESLLGEISLKNFSFSRYDQAFQMIKEKGGVLYGNAFILCATRAFGYEKKHQNHLALLEKVFVKERTVTDLLRADSLQSLFYRLRSLPLIGDFMAYQIAIDFNYSPLFDFSENDFTVAGPGALRGIRKCFIDTDGKKPEEIIQFMVNGQDKEFSRLGLKFRNLFGRPMQAIDCQGWFCETDKYCRVKFPQLASNRVRIKTTFKPTPIKIDYYFPPKWKISSQGLD